MQNSGLRLKLLSKYQKFQSQKWLDSVLADFIVAWQWRRSINGMGVDTWQGHDIIIPGTTYGILQ